MLAVEPGTLTLGILHHEESAALAHLLQWAHQVAPDSRLLTIDANGVLHGFGADGGAVRPAGSMIASVRRLRNDFAR